MKVSITFLFAFACFALLPETGGATVRHVPSQYATIQAAINAAAVGDTVLVDEGTYKENIVLTKKITVGSSFVVDGDTSHLSRTIIDGSQPSNPYAAAVVTIDGATDTTTVLSGFTITGGKGNLRSVNYPGIPQYQMIVGIGVDIAGGGARIAHNIVRANNCNVPTVSVGGVINIFDVTDKNGVSYAIIEHNTIADNVLVGHDGEGGAFAIGHSSAIRDNLIARNTVHGSIEPGVGGAFEIWNGVVNIEGNRIINNSASHEGGGLCVYSVQAAGVVPHVAMVNNILMGNASGTLGGGVYVTGKDVALSMVNNTFSSNTAATGGSGLSIDSAIVRALNTILWDTGGTEIQTSSGGSLVASYCDIHGGFTGTGNINSDPKLSSTGVDSLGWLDSSSACIDAGVISANVAGVVLTAPGKDIYGKTRPSGHSVDIGACEKLITGVPAVERSVPPGYGLDQNYPNPFNPNSNIRYQISEFRYVKLAVYDLLGREVAVLVNEKKAPGSYEVTFDGSALATGVYFYRLAAGEYVGCRKMVLMK
jgi:hypothetical protein